MTQENINWIIILLSLLIILYLRNNYVAKKRLKKFKQGLIKNWGKEKTNRQFNFYSISQYFENNLHKNKAYHIISDETASDLDINEIFKFIDRTSSKIGQQYLYYKLRTIHSIKELDKFDKLSNLFHSNNKIRIKSQLILSQLNSNKAYDLEVLINDEPIQKPKYLKIIYGISLLAVVVVLISFSHPVIALFLIPIFAINLVFHYKNKQNAKYYLSAINQLKRSIKVGSKLVEIDEIKQHYNNFSFFKNVSKIKRKTEFMSFDRHIDSPFLYLIWHVVELIKVLFNIGTISFYRFIDDVNSEKENIDKLFQFIGEIDAAISIASLKSSNISISKPNFTNSKKITFKKIIHPLIKNCVPNNLTLDKKSLLLTGSNMSGKTTFIRTIAINSILAETLNICFSEEFTSPFLKVYSSIRLTDDLLEDTSYYLQEVLRIKKLIDASKNDATCLFVLDEIFKGTNTIERVAGGKAILSYLNSENHFVLVSTHDIELTDLLENNNYNLYHFTEKITNNKLLFDHKLKKGKLKTRNALKILELYNYPKEIITDARNTEKGL